MVSFSPDVLKTNVLFKNPVRERINLNNYIQSLVVLGEDIFRFRKEGAYIITLYGFQILDLPFSLFRMWSVKLIETWNWKGNTK